MTATDTKPGTMLRLWPAAGLVVLLMGVGVLAGCGNSSGGAHQSQATEAGPVAPELTKVQQAFAAARPDLKFALEDILRPVKAGIYADALPGLRKLLANPGLAANQKQALQELLQKLETMPAR